MDTPVSSFTIPVTAQFGDRLEHQVSDQNVYQQGDSGAVCTLCGVWIIPAPLLSPGGRPCAACAAKIGYRRLRC